MVGTQQTDLAQGKGGVVGRKLVDGLLSRPYPQKQGDVACRGIGQYLSLSGGKNAAYYPAELCARRLNVDTHSAPGIAHCECGISGTVAHRHPPLLHTVDERRPCRGMRQSRSASAAKWLRPG